MRINHQLLLAIMLTASPTVTRAQTAGQLVSAEVATDAPAGMQAWRVRYWTTDGSGQLRQVTGMVAAPLGAPPGAPRPILAWTHGTWGVASKCAPSLSPNFWDGTPGLQAIAQGYVVVAPDYAGLGSAGVHPFLVGDDTARSVADGVRAAASIPAAGAGKRFAVWGESQGGHAALWTAQRTRAYAPDLTLVGAAAAAPPTDLIANLRAVANPSLKSFFTAYIGYSWAANYGAPMASFGNQLTQGLMNRLAANSCITPDLQPKLGLIVGITMLNRPLQKVDIGNVQPWARLAALNSPATTNLRVPLLIGQNPNDVLVSPTVTAAHVAALCRSGNQVKQVTITGQGHATSAKDSAAVTLAWIADRFAGRPVPNDCR